MALGSFFVPPGYTGPVPAGYTEVFYNPIGVGVTNLTPFDDIVIGSDIGAKWIDTGGYDILDYSGFGQGITINEAEGTVRDASGIIGAIAAVPSRGFEEYRGTAFNDVLVAAAGDAQILRGEGGDDTLVGGINVELLDGGTGIDTASYSTSAAGVTVDLTLGTGLGDSTVASAGKDTITDFATGDHIDLSAIDADGNEANGDTGFSFGTGAFTGHAGELRVVTAGTVQVVCRHQWRPPRRLRHQRPLGPPADGVQLRAVGRHPTPAAGQTRWR